MKTMKIEKKLEQEFIQKFGEKAYKSLKEACRYHIERGDIHKVYKGNFMQVILITIGFQCVAVDEYREFHGIPITWEDFRRWLLKHKKEIAKCKLDENDIDYLALFSGAYDFLVDRGDNQ